MDMASIGASLGIIKRELAKIGSAITGANTAAEEAKNAADAANRAAENISGLDEREKVGAIADNMRYSILQAQVRKLQDAVEMMQNQISALV